MTMTMMTMMLLTLLLTTTIAVGMTTRTTTTATTTTTTARTRIQYRTAQASDLWPITKLLVESFEEHQDTNNKNANSNMLFSLLSPSSWPSLTSLSWIESKRTQFQIFQGLQGRYWMGGCGGDSGAGMSILLNRKQQPHVMIVAIVMNDDKKCQKGSGSGSGSDGGDGNGESPMIAGFMEIGTMPLPVEWLNGGTTAAGGAAGADAGAGAMLTDQKAVARMPVCRKTTEMPYLANLCVSKLYQRQGIGTTMVKLALKVSQKYWYNNTKSNNNNNNQTSIPALCLAVEQDNVAAVEFYKRLQFDVIFQEDSNAADNDNRQDSLQRARQRQRRPGRKPRLYLAKKRAELEE